jgi:hypothetical protein
MKIFLGILEGTTFEQEKAVCCMYLWKGKEKKNKAPYSNTFGSYPTPPKKNKGCVTLCGLAIYIKKYLFKAKEELWKLKYFHHAKIYLIFKKIL